VRAAAADAAEPSADARGVADAALRMLAVPVVLAPKLMVLLGWLGMPDAAGWLRMAMLPMLHSDMAALMRLSQSAAEVRGVINICLQQQQRQQQPAGRLHQVAIWHSLLMNKTVHKLQTRLLRSTLWFAK
jgi:hypothetical protein